MTQSFRSADNSVFCSSGTSPVDAIKMLNRDLTGGLVLFQYFSGVTDAQRISRCLNAVYLSSPQPCFVTVFSLILSVARDDTFMN